jgi:bifunctional non-homologous end joining protein LigD
MATARSSFVAFDLLHLNGEKFRKLPLIERRARLTALVRTGRIAGAVQFSEHMQGSGDGFSREVDRLGLEGMVSKRASSIYRSGRTVSGVLRAPFASEPEGQCWKP